MIHVIYYSDLSASGKMLIYNYPMHEYTMCRLVLILFVFVAAPSTGREIVCTPQNVARVSSMIPDKSPVSRNREVAAAELSYVEDLENNTLNLNIAETGADTSSQPVPWRRVKPGPCARSPFVLGYDPPLRAQSKLIGFWKKFLRHRGANLTE
jgi:hypothetical protein